MHFSNNISPIKKKNNKKKNLMIIHLSFQKTTIGKALINITATDNDAGPNKDIRYEFKGEKPKEFELNSNTGALTLRTSLDYERQTSYTLEVIAKVRKKKTFSQTSIFILNYFWKTFPLISNGSHNSSFSSFPINRNKFFPLL